MGIDVLSAGVNTVEMTRGYHINETHRFITEIEAGELVSEAVVRTLSTVAERNPLEIEPLYSSIDPDALDDLFGGNGRSRGAKSVAFEHENHEIVITDGDMIVVSGATVNPPTSVRE